MEEKNRLIYDPPAVWIVEVEAEGVVCASGGLTNYDKEDYELW